MTSYWHPSRLQSVEPLHRKPMNEPTALLDDKPPIFEEYSYLDKLGRLKAGSRRSKSARAIYRSFNTFIVLMGGILAVVSGLAMGMSGYPIIGGFFFSLILTGAFVQRSTFDYDRVYGVWRGSCPHCDGPLNISAREDEAKKDTCLGCGNRVLLRNRSFEVVPWYE